VAADIAALHQVLLHPQRCAYRSENVCVLQGNQATNRGIRAGLAWLRSQLAGDEQATAVIYYSGHGWKDRYAGEYFLIPYDIEADHLRYTALRAADFAVEISKIQVPRLLVLLDCCHAQGMGVKNIEAIGEFVPASLPAVSLMGAEKGVELTPTGGKGLETLIQGHGRAILSSSQGDQPSFIRPDGKMSLFTCHLIEALTGHAAPLEGASEVLVSDVAGYVQRHVPESARKMGKEQEPDARITGIFPVALLLGGKGLPKGVTPPDPLENLSTPPVDNSLRQTVSGQGTAVIGSNNIVAGKGGFVITGKVEGDVISGGKTQVTTDRSFHYEEDHSIHLDRVGSGSNLITGDHNTLQFRPATGDSEPTREQFGVLLADLCQALARIHLDPAEQTVVENDLARVAREVSVPQPDRERILTWLNRVLSFLTEAPQILEMGRKLLDWAEKVF
jgi:hypothetical protein